VPYRVIVYMTVFGEEDVPAAVDGGPQYAGISFTYSVLPDVTSIDPVEGPYWNTLQDGLIEPASALSAEIPFGKAGNDPIYDAYDPVLIHNNPAESGADVALKKAHILGNPFPSLDDLPAWAGTEDPAVRPGSLVAVRVQRASIGNPVTEYTSSIGFIGVRWRLEPIST
jgi:hypothetical protein